MLRGAASFVDHWDAIRDLRTRLNALDDVMLDPIHFLTATDETRRSCSVACWRRGQLVGVLYSTEHFVRGIRTGYAIAGDFSGRGMILCAPEDETFVLRACVKRMLASGIHSLHLRFLPSQAGPMAFKGCKLKVLDAEIPGDRLDLRPSYEQFLSVLGKHTRRNVRACTRRTADLGILFVSHLSREEYDAAVRHLNAETNFPADPLRLERDARLLVLHDGERMGLRSREGAILAVLCGFRVGDRFHLLTQLNDANFERLSLSLVLRGHTIRHLIETGVQQLQFMGGSSLSFGRYCQPESYRSIFIDRRLGVAAALKRLCAGAVTLLTRFGTPVPEQLAALCNGFLEESILSQRTVLRPAAMLMSQRRVSST